MMTIVFLFILSISLSLLLMILVPAIIGAVTITNREKLTPFECGFDPMKKSRSPFSLRFFMVAIMFLIFDVEIVMLMPFIFISSTYNSTWVTLLITLMITILILGLLHEWNQGSLNWVM